LLIVELYVKFRFGIVIKDIETFIKFPIKNFKVKFFDNKLEKLES